MPLLVLYILSMFNALVELVCKAFQVESGIEMRIDLELNYYLSPPPGPPAAYV